MDAQSKDLFQFGLDSDSRADLVATARWAKFLAIVGMIGMGLALLVGIIAIVAMQQMMNSYSPYGGFGYSRSSPLAMIFFLLLGIALYIYPTIALLRFGSNMAPALASQDQRRFNLALASLKGMFKYIGIVTIVLLSIYALIFLFALVRSL